jgi:hypothetical protein
MRQFWLYLQNLAHGDLGPSLHWRDFTVYELFAKALPVSAMLGAIFAGTALGLAGAMSKGAIGPRANRLRDIRVENFRAFHELTLSMTTFQRPLSDIYTKLHGACFRLDIANPR